MSIEAIITQVATVQTTITGVKRAHDNAPESLNELPAFINYPSLGLIERVPQVRISHHTIKMLLFVTRQNLPTAEALLRPFLRLTLEKFDENIQLGGTCMRSGISRYEYGVLYYTNKTYLGIVFDLEVWEEEAKAFV